MRENEEWKDRKHNFDNYVKYLHGQVEELCINYGKIDIFFFDFSYDKMYGDAWKAKELVKMIRSYHPDIVINHRLELTSSPTIFTSKPAEYSGDFAAPEQMIPPEGMTDEAGNPIPWEACLTLDDHWGYCSGRNSYKPASLLIRSLVECCSKGGNMLLNVGPDSKGRFPDNAVKTLKEIGAWMKKNGESIYHCGDAGIPKPNWGWYTKNGNKVYAHITQESIFLHSVKFPWKIKKIRLLTDGTERLPYKGFNTDGFPGYTFFALSGWGYTPLPDPIDTVVEFEIE